MRLSNFFIDRPIFSWVLAIVVMLAGAFSVTQLPLEQYPNVAPPMIQIKATYSGASAQTALDSVVQIIEQQMVGLDHLMYMSSTANSSGNINIRLTFASGTNPDEAQVQVQDALQAANSLLPTQVQEAGVTVTKASPDQFMVLALVSEDGKMSQAQIADYVYSNLEEPIQRLTGVGQAQELGSEYAMRIWIDPGKLQKYSLMPSDVTTAIDAQNDDIASGEIGGLPSIQGQEIDATVTARSRLTTAQQFRDIVLKTETNGSQVLLSDVARVELGPQTYTVSGEYDNKPAGALGLDLAPGANEMQVSEEVHNYLDKQKASLPPGVKVEYPYETMPFVKISVQEVVKTLIEAIILVVLIMYLFLQDLRATLIPTIAVPVVLLGTFGILNVLGYTINTMTMFGLVLAIGLLVDDAIVVVENVERVMREERLSAVDATRKSMAEISGALVGIAMVLSAVLLPMAFFGGSTGVIYRQFSVSVISAMVLSVLVALTLTPTLCATLLKPGHHNKRGRFFDAFNRGFDKTANGYTKGVRGILGRRGMALVVYAIIVLVGGYLFHALPTSFLPIEDQGRLMVQITGPVGGTKERTLAAMHQAQQIMMKQAGVSDVLAVSGFSVGTNGQNVGQLWVILKPWDQRPNDTAPQIVRNVRAAIAGIQDAKVYVLQPPTVRGLGQSSGFDMELIDQAGLGHAALVKARDQLIAMASKDPNLRQVHSLGMNDEPQFSIHIDDKKASSMGVAAADVNTTLEDAMGGAYVDQFVDAGRVKDVYIEADTPYRMVPNDLDNWYVRNSSEQMVPLSAFATTNWSYGPPELDRYNGESSFEIIGDPAPNVSSGVAMQDMEDLVAKLPHGISSTWTGLSYQEQLSGTQAPYMYAVSVLFVFLCLAALYESWSIPFSVMLTVPAGILGAALFTTLRGLSNDVYFQIGLLVTVGLSAKNAILIVEFARLLEQQGQSTMKAIMHAVLMRLRPILMTSAAFLLGILPLAISTGAGSQSRHSIGTGVLGGTLLGTGLGIFLTPLFYVLISGLSNRMKHQNKTSEPGTPASEEGDHHE